MDPHCLGEREKPELFSEAYKAFLVKFAVQAFVGGVSLGSFLSRGLQNLPCDCEWKDEGELMFASKAKVCSGTDGVL